MKKLLAFLASAIVCIVGLLAFGTIRQYYSGALTAIPIFVTSVATVWVWRVLTKEPNSILGSPTSPSTYETRNSSASTAPPERYAALDAAALEIAENERQRIAAQANMSTTSVTASPPHTEGDEIYAQVADELETGKTDKGLWTRLYAECDGDEKRAKVQYIKQRVNSLQSARRDQREAEQVKAAIAAKQRAEAERMMLLKEEQAREDERLRLQEEKKAEELRAESEALITYGLRKRGLGYMSGEKYFYTLKDAIAYASEPRLQ